jgi:hypothetical protein
MRENYETLSRDIPGHHALSGEAGCGWLAYSISPNAQEQERDSHQVGQGFTYVAASLAAQASHLDIYTTSHPRRTPSRPVSAPYVGR